MARPLDLSGLVDRLRGPVTTPEALRSVAFDPATATTVAQAGAGWREIDRAT